MRFSSIIFLANLLGAGIACADCSYKPSTTLRPIATRTRLRNTYRPTGTPCAGNAPNDRSVWCNYSIDTDYENVVPDTGVTREYWFEVKEVTLSPDGFMAPRPVMTINGTFPGPPLVADWGDWVVVHVSNHLYKAMNGSSIHWHGIRQNYTNPNDGVPSLTQCPIAPGSTMTYKWRAGQYGSSWYHSHIGLQAWEGVYGAIIINGPATANYDVDKGALFLSDWTHETVDQLHQDVQLRGPVRKLSNGLLNGKNVYGNGTNTTGSPFHMKVQKGKSYRLRLVNPAIDTHWKFTIDNHIMTVIAMDLVPIKPFVTNVVSIGMGQRYDVIITANQESVAESFWMRAIPADRCSQNEMAGNIRGIVYYGNRPKQPRTQSFPFTNVCEDELLTNLIPHVPKNVDLPVSPVWDRNVTVSNTRNAQNFFRWQFNSTSMNVSWENPTLMQVYHSDPGFSTSSGVIELPFKNKWVYLFIQNTLVTHPIHLHGHDFSILAQGQPGPGKPQWDGSIITQNPPRRDTAVLAGGGWLLIAFKTNNPGAWLMHCHIGWHVDEGLALQFIERQDEIRDLIDYTPFNENCAAWDKYVKTKNVVQQDSGV
ncbi:CAZyme family AA1 [Penicillium roqueforti]|uniref:CAZyme family AA1 n=1 Tax=Penicillium roqueforti TaxID=5082 RepID=UPI00190E3288|nr:CAZyme family AA1 [Penicillium roqueforti]KAF9250421.1 CAZyme family AA1 [Penicillium roqueforti]KAI1833108.1 CAZyme family AA1 [Penicillium roqueforti]KAI2671578.1 CAZyme family AA1 [Penicillium roqueforti]KAI3147230.1 CAZyme family AA1 [Penicillium roqueforti]KAI3211625.1 CAZyme family AA1 [Penicillium roqueforti]